ncbi:guanine nucleotide-releasing factor 2 isoform X2 [Chironomus tepperi]|uniref:guanine nucleotide-releasing factor 2 isoform X2 n=1 Tax=Chironomus tepperi TaxID=113505 RepID=UPI00391F9A0C
MNERELGINNSFNDVQLSSSLLNDDINTSNHSFESKNATKNTKLARIRSFKDDFLEKISQMRTPMNTSTLTRPNSPKHKKAQQHLFHDDTKLSNDLEYHVRQAKTVLTHFNDVINKDKLEMLPGNGTILLETIANINSSLKNNKFYAKSSVILSLIQQLQSSLGKIIKICDDALISETENDFIAENKQNINDLIVQLREGVNNLVEIVHEKKSLDLVKNYQQPSFEVDIAGQSQRNSLPDITPKEEKQQFYSSLNRTHHVKKSQSNENILESPPPKPSRQLSSAPPLPPKRSIFTTLTTVTKDSVDNSFLNLDNDQYLKPNDKSPDKNSSTSSLCSMLLESCALETKYNEESTIKSSYRTSSDSGSMSINSQTNVMKQHQRQIIINSTEHLDNDFNSEHSFREERESYSSSNSLMSTTKFNISSELPPPLPMKTRRSDHHKSVYDNVDCTESNQSIVTTTVSSSNSSLASSSLNSSALNVMSSNENNNFDFIEQSYPNIHNKIKYISCIEPRNLLIGNNSDEKPPLPPKKNKHIMAYMEIFGNASHSSHMSSQNLMLTRHSMHIFAQSSKCNSQERVFFDEPNPLLPPIPSEPEEAKPALPPKKVRLNSRTPSTPPLSPKIEEFVPEIPTTNSEVVELNNELEKPCSNNISNELKHQEKEEVVLRRKSKTTPDLIEEVEVGDHLIFKKEEEDGPDIKGGHADALIVHATKVQKVSEAFGEAFLCTFRTFIEPFHLVEKLTHRYSFFICHNHDQKQKAAKESFSLLVRVVNDLTIPDLTVILMQKLINFVHDLIISGEIPMAKLLRTKIIEKAMMLKQKRSATQSYLSSLPIISNPPTLLDLKSTELAEQMTILDAELFQKIEIPEVLLWSQQQCEEKSPNLTLFTAHFNKLSFWARTQILKQQDAKDREKYVMKFIKIMKHLRKINNYNSYLAILSALDSAPIRRLEWQKNITEGLKEYCALIDSSSSFRAYRQALSETTSPCIPYIGLVLQDLTFVHIGNPDLLQDGSINFSKRWQQYNIVMNMKRFRNSSYAFKRNERIIGFFDSFEDCFDEDVMWQISEKIKPRISRKVE